MIILYNGLNWSACVLTKAGLVAPKKVTEGQFSDCWGETTLGEVTARAIQPFLIERKCVRNKTPVLQQSILRLLTQYTVPSAENGPPARFDFFGG